MMGKFSSFLMIAMLWCTGMSFGLDAQVKTVNRSSMAAQDSTQKTVQWSNQPFEDKGFLLYAPGQSEEKTLSTATEIGGIDQHTILWRDDHSETENYLYTVTIFDYPSGTLHPDSADLIKALFDETVLTSEESLNAKSIYTDQSSTYGYPSSVWKMAMKNEVAFVKSKMILVGDRCYTLQVFMLKEYQKNKFADQFLQSFRLI